MIDAIAEAFTQIITWVGSFTSALTANGGALHSLLPLFAIGIAVSLVMVCMKIVRKITWGS